MIRRSLDPGSSAPTRILSCRPFSTQQDLARLQKRAEVSIQESLFSPGFRGFIQGNNLTEQSNDLTEGLNILGSDAMEGIGPENLEKAVQATETGCWPLNEISEEAATLQNTPKLWADALGGIRAAGLLSEAGEQHRWGRPETPPCECGAWGFLRAGKTLARSG